MKIKDIPDFLGVKSEEISKLFNEKKKSDKDEELLSSSPEVKELVNKAHELRNSLANDMGTRRRNRLGDREWFRRYKYAE